MYSFVSASVCGGCALSWGYTLVCVVSGCGCTSVWEGHALSWGYTLACVVSGCNSFCFSSPRRLSVRLSGLTL